MRLEIELLADDKKKINFNYNYYITSAIYNLLSEHDKNFSCFLHEQGFQLGSKKFKLFVYSRLMPKKYTIDGAYMLINEGVTRLYINSPVTEFINCIGNSLMKNGFMNIGEETFKVNNIYLKDDFRFDYETKFEALSPIVVTTGIEKDGRIKARALHIKDEKYKENIKNNLIKKYYLVHGKIPENLSIDIEFDSEYIRKNIKGHLVNFKGITVKGYIAPFTMKCSDDLKKVAIDCGIGENNSIGMGYILPK